MEGILMSLQNPAKIYFRLTYVHGSYNQFFTSYFI